MTGLVERMARAIGRYSVSARWEGQRIREWVVYDSVKNYREVGGPYSSEAQAHDAAKLLNARAALRECLEPTEKMVEAARGATCYDCSAREIWRAMIRIELDEG